MERTEPEAHMPSYEELVQQNQSLRQEVTRLKAEKQAIWSMLSGTNRRLQMASAAIKAAVSSLLNYDIFWDGANEHEFLETINTSVDQAGRSIKLLTLAFRLEAGLLELKREPQVLQEIISVVQERVSRNLPDLVFGITLPQEGRPVVVDYDFLMTALELLLDGLEQMGVRRVGIQAVEEPARWVLQFEGLDESSLEVIAAVPALESGAVPTMKAASAEVLLRMYIAFQILQMQDIQVEIPNSSNQPSKLRLVVPIPG